MTEYEAAIQEAEGAAARGWYKEAYNTLAKALWIGGPADQECRYRRGVYAYEVAHSRLNDLDQTSSPAKTLIKVSCWLSRSEAYLESASEGVDEVEQERIKRDIDRTMQEQERFRQLCRELDIDLFVPKGNGDGNS